MVSYVKPKEIYIPEDIEFHIYKLYFKEHLFPELLLKCKSPVFVIKTQSPIINGAIEHTISNTGYNTSVEYLFDNYLYCYLTRQSEYSFQEMYSIMNRENLWKYATQTNKHLLLDFLNKYKYLPVQFKFLTEREINLQTCVEHFIYMNEKGLENYINQVRNDFFTWGRGLESELWKL